MSFVAFTGVIHTWPAFKASLKYQRKELQAKIGIFALLSILALMSTFTLLDLSISKVHGWTNMIIFLFAPAALMAEAYFFRLERGER